MQKSLHFPKSKNILQTVFGLEFLQSVVHRYVSAIYRKKGEHVVLEGESRGETEEERGKWKSGVPLGGKDPQLLTLRAGAESLPGPSSGRAQVLGTKKQ